jgi:hypothetical protein
LKFFEDNVRQSMKSGKIVCGDAFLIERSLDCTVFVLCDGIGSGVYANIAAIACASRLLELFSAGVSQGAACEMVAESMHRARKESIPFSAFTAARILPDGHFTVYSYEAPAPVIIKDGTASVLKPHFTPAGLEQIGESAGMLGIGDSLVLCSDGVTQAGLGHGYTFGIGSEGLAEYINYSLSLNIPISAMPDRICAMAAQVSGGRYEDDTTAAVLTCRNARELTVLSGPPSLKSRDRAFVERFMASARPRIVCGSTTAEILARELNREITLKSVGISLGNPPEYFMEDIDLITEGAVVLNQINNLLGENPDRFVNDTPAERVSAMLLGADVVRFIIGRSVNNAHTELLFKQLGIRPRDAAIRMMIKKLQEMGKLIIDEYY